MKKFLLTCAGLLLFATSLSPMNNQSSNCEDTTESHCTYHRYLQENEVQIDVKECFDIIENNIHDNESRHTINLYIITDLKEECIKILLKILHIHFVEGKDTAIVQGKHLSNLLKYHSYINGQTVILELIKYSINDLINLSTRRKPFSKLAIKKKIKKFYTFIRFSNEKIAEHINETTIDFLKENPIDENKLDRVSEVFYSKLIPIKNLIKNVIENYPEALSEEVIEREIKPRDEQTLVINDLIRFHTRLSIYLEDLQKIDKKEGLHD